MLTTHIAGHGPIERLAHLREEKNGGLRHHKYTNDVVQILWTRGYAFSGLNLGLGCPAQPLS